ncbi:MAG: protein kinase, partial [Myxococcota bacterium]
MSRLMELFEAAVELEPHARATFLDRACPGDPQLRERVEALLQTDAEADPSFLDAPPVDAGLVETVLKGAPAGEAPVQIGETLGVYTIEGLLGHGSMGWVYRARHSVLGRDVALKVLGAELTRDPELVARFFAEAKVVNAIRHPNIIDVTDFIDELEPRRVGYVMTLLGGASLDNVLRERRLTLPQVVNIAWQLLDTLEAVHAGDVVHRDLKPENVFVTGDLATDLSAVPSVVVLDFGVAKIAERSGYRTATGAVVGTPRYMAPEQVQGTEVGPASDLYAWALIVVEMWTGEPVFRGSVPGILQAKLSAQAAPLPTLEVKPGLEPLVRVLQQCLAPLPSLRPESAEIRHALLPLMRRGAKITRTTVAVLDETEMALTPWREEAARLGGEALSEDEGGLTVAFEDPNTALHFATLVTEARERAQIGVDTASDVGQGHSTAQALARAAAPGGVLVGSITAHSARTEGLTGSAGSLAWTSHGIVSVDGLRHPVEVFELGEGVTSKTELRQVAADPTLRGWRPSPGLIVPGRAPWRLMRALASGGFGEVWVAEDAEGRQRVFKFAFEERAARSLEREARLHHWLAQDLGQRTDILSVLNLHDGSPPHLETELIPGGDLSRWLDRQGGAGRVPIDQRIELVAQAAEALAEVHAVGVLHRDIKPGNLLVREPPQVVLADFGIGGMAEPTPAAEGEAGERAPDSVQLAGTLL